MWLQNSPDLSPVNYAIWSVIQLDAAGNILRVHYRSMQSDVSFSLGSVSTSFRWGHVYIKHFFLLTTVQKLFLKIHQDFPELWSQMYCHLFMVDSVNETVHCRLRLTLLTSTLNLIRCGNTQHDLCRRPLTYFMSTSASHCKASSHWSAAAVLS